jgi:hypothetical protein
MRSNVSNQTCDCGRPVNGTTLCRDCKHTLEVALANIATYHHDLEVVRTRAKAVRYDLPHGKGPGREGPLPVDERFLPGGRGTESLNAARNAVVTWVRVVLDEWPPEPFERLLVCGDALCKRCSRIRYERQLRRHPADTVASCCRYLARMLDRIASAPWAPDLMHDVLGAERALKRVDARGPERVYAGLCTVCLLVGDRTAMYAVVGEEFVKCPAADCGMDYRVEQRRNLMRDALEYEWMSAARIADLATYLQLLGDREWVRKKINRWHNDGTLRPASVDDAGNPLFPFGEATRLLSAADASRRVRLKGA